MIEFTLTVLTATIGVVLLLLSAVLLAVAILGVAMHLFTRLADDEIAVDGAWEDSDDALSSSAVVISDHDLSLAATHPEGEVLQGGQDPLPGNMRLFIRPQTPPEETDHAS